MRISSERLMVFIDGTNLLYELSKEIDRKFRADKPPFSVFRLARIFIDSVFSGTHLQVIRRFWFASYQGDETVYTKLRKELRLCGFEPILFKKHDGKENGVDIALTKEMLVNAFNQNFDIGVLIAGDEDYVGLVNEVKRYGPRIYGAFFEHGLSTELSLSCDTFSYFRQEGTYKTDITAAVQAVRTELQTS